MPGWLAKCLGEMPRQLPWSGGLSIPLRASRLSGALRSEEVGAGNGGHDVTGCDLPGTIGGNPSAHHPLPCRTSRAHLPSGLDERAAA